MTSYILDTNGLLRYLLNDIPVQAEVVETLFQAVKRKESTVTMYPLVILEAVFVLWKLYKEEKRDIAAQLLKIVNAPIIDVRERSAVQFALKMWTEQSLSFVDAYLLFQSRTEGKTLMTFDKKLKRLANITA